MSLQNVTESLLQKDKILPSDVAPLTPEERYAMGMEINERLKKMVGQEREDFLDKVEQIVPANSELKNQRWELNHAEIIRVISNHVKEFNAPPTKNIIAEKTGLSRQTVHRHMNEYAESKDFADHQKSYKILNEKVMAKLYQFACMGNVKAARLFFEMNGSMGKGSTTNFYIQINSIKVDEAMIKALPAETLVQIEQLICQSTPVKNLH